MQNIIFTANIVAPVFIIVALGFLLKKIGLMNENFITLSSKIVFTVSLPALVFMELSGTDFGRTFDPGVIGFAIAGTFFSFILSWLIAAPFIKSGKDRGTFIQGSFRGNFAIVGFAIISNLFGSVGLAKASILLAFMLPIYNVLAVIALTVPVRKERELNLKDTVFEILKNPLILAVIVALPFSIFKIPVTGMFAKTGNYLAAIALPLALIGIGGSLNIQNIKEASALAFSSTFIKIILTPLILIYAAVKMGYAGTDLGIMFVLFGCPTAIASFIMADAMGGNRKLAGNIVLITTVASVITMTAGIFILKEMGLF